MKTTNRNFALSILFLAMLPTVFFAQGIETKKVSFPAGKTSTVINGTIKGSRTIDYTVETSTGQELSVSLNSKSTAIYFNVLPPGSNGEAIYVGETDGSNKFSGQTQGGVYKIRVFINRAAARRNESANYGLKISVIWSGNPNPTPSRSNDAKVPGTNFNATGQLDVSLGTEAKGSKTADFGVIRKSYGNVTIKARVKGILPCTLNFSNGKWTSEGNKVKTIRRGDEWEVIVNDYEHYYIPDAVVYGG